MLRSPRALLLVALLVLSVATLVMTIVGNDNKLLYGLATTVSHVALVVVGTTFVKRGSHERRVRSRKSNR